MVRTAGRIGYARLTTRGQMAMFLTLVVVGTWGVFSTISFVLHDRVLAAKNNEILSANLEYRSLLNEVGEYQRKFTQVTRDLEENHSLMLDLLQQNASLQQDLNSVANRLRSTDEERRRVISTREMLKERLSKLEGDMTSLATRNYSLKDNLDSIESRLRIALAERNEALSKGHQLKRYNHELETRIAQIQEAQHETVQRLTERTAQQIETMERVIELAGLDPQSILDADDRPLLDQGGPFFAIPEEGLPGDRLKANLTVLDLRLQQSDALQEVLRKMPMAPPLDTFQVNSPFGKRRDPVNKRWAMHYGVDLGAKAQAPVLATAPGVIVEAGWKGLYGKTVEIDHGAGLRTRYGHLSKILVKKGAVVNAHDKVGLLGSTGRTTGPHLHYEITFRNKNLNPMNFLRAGRYVFQQEQ